MDLTGYSGVCFTPQDINEQTYQICCDDLCEDQGGPDGCIRLNITDEFECQEINGTWRTPDVNCSSVNGCFDERYRIFKDLSEDECSSCMSSSYLGALGCTWKPIYSWVPPQWTPPSTSKLTWTTRRYKPTRTFSQSINWTLIQDFESSLVQFQKIPYLDHESCFYANLKSTIQTIICGRNDTCLNQRRKNAIQLVRSCPFIITSYASSIGSIFIAEDTFIDGECQNILAFSLPARKLARVDTPPSSSEVFKVKPVNDLSIVVNAEGTSVGQIISSGYNITFKGKVFNPIYLCLTAEFRLPISDVFTEENVGYLDGSVVRLLKPSKVPEPEPLTRKRQKLLTGCANITESGVYFLVFTYPEYETAPFLTQSQVGQLYAGAVIYTILFLNVIIVLVISLYYLSKAWDYHHIIGWLDKFAISYFLTFLFSGTRAGFFFALANTRPSTIVTYIFFEGPTFLYLSLYVHCLAKWDIFLIVTSDKYLVGTSATLDRNLRIGWASVHIILYAIFFAFLFVTIFPPDYQEAPCVVEYSSSSQVYLIYLIFLVALALFLAIAFLISAVFMVVRLRHIDLKACILLAGTGALFTMAFLTKSALFLWCGITGSSFPPLIFVLLEVVPVLTLLWVHVLQDTQASSSAATSASIATSTGKKEGGSGTKSDLPILKTTFN